MDPKAAETAERLRSKHIRTLEMLEQLAEENKALRAGRADFASGSDPGEVARLKAEMEAAQAYVSELEDRLVDASKFTEARLAEAAAGFQVQLQEVQARLANAQSSNDAYGRRCRELEGTLEAMRGVLAKEAAAKAAAEMEAGPSVATAVAVTQLGPEGDADLRPADDPRVAELMARLSESRAECEDARVDNRALADEVAALKQKAGDAGMLQVQLDAAQERLRDIEAGRSAAGGEAADRVRALEARNAALESDARRLKDAHAQAQLERDEWRSKVDAVATEVGRLKHELAAAQARIKELQAAAESNAAGADAKRIFVKHVAIAKENQLLRAQVQSMKEERRRFMAKVRTPKMGLA